MISVAHLTSAHPRYDPRIFLKQCKGLVDHGYKVSLVVADGKGRESVEGVDILDVGLLPGRINRILRTTERVFQAALDLKADLYHLHDPELIPAGLRLKRHGKRVIFDSHEDVPVQLLSKPYLNPWILRALSGGYAVFEKFACARFDGVVAATPFIRDKFLKINPRTVDVCNYPALEEFTPSDDWCKKRNEVCYVGGVSAVRGARELVMALAQVQTDVRLNLVGAFSDTDFRAELENTPGWSRINEFGVLDRNGVREVYARSCAGLVTLHPISNYLDALPIKMFEYMSAGIPVIASDFPLWRQIVLSADCGVCVDPLNPAAVAEAIDELGHNPARAQAMGHNGRMAVETRFNWKTEEAKLVAFYEQVLSPQKRSFQ
jgi:glycosyltransferase involved in cell wall biosynthesis